MNLKPRTSILLFYSFMLLCFSLFSNSAHADILYASCTSSEILSNWDSRINFSASGPCGYSPSSIFNYNSDLANGANFQAYASASSEFGQLKLYGSFSAANMPAGSNVALYDSENNPIWTNVPVNANATLRDGVMLNGPLSTYDLVLPIALEGGFAMSSTPGIEPLGTGVTGFVEIFVGASQPGVGYLATGYLRMKTDQGLITGNYAPGVYDITLPDLPANELFNLRFYASVGFNLLDEVQFSEQVYPDLKYPENITIDANKTINYRTGLYAVSGTADFANTISFGSYLAYSNGVQQQDVTLTSENGANYYPVPEPSTLALLGGGLGLVGLAAWRKRK